MDYCAERQAVDNKWVLTTRGLKELRSILKNRWSVDENEEYAAEIGIDVWGDAYYR